MKVILLPALSRFIRVALRQPLDGLSEVVAHALAVCLVLNPPCIPVVTNLIL